MSETKSLSPRWSALHLLGPVWARLLTPGLRVEEGFTACPPFRTAPRAAQHLRLVRLHPPGGGPHPVHFRAVAS
eukprot:7385728-Alexandrium_andersonii.AAC.1